MKKNKRKFYEKLQEINIEELENGGFSYIETVVCILIILLLTVTVGISAMKIIDRAKEAKCKKEIETFVGALDQYYTECGKYPTENQGLNALWEKPVLYPVPAAWNGPYINSELPLDPWGFEYHYKVPGKNNLPYEIFSYGSDGEEGGKGSAKDIYSWKRRE